MAQTDMAQTDKAQTDKAQTDMAQTEIGTGTERLGHRYRHRQTEAQKQVVTHVGIRKAQRHKLIVHMPASTWNIGASTAQPAS